ncbi:hypothetical protein NFI96_006808 [Prochilodus magdalenae]|nr:hypothetical protein NFI96_006808 [Prochilodus magdalenae]
MAFYTRCLQDLPKVTINDVQHIVQASSTAPRSKREKGFKMYVSSYIDNKAAVSLCNLVFIAVDRYIAVCDPLLYYTRVTVCKTTVFIILGWSCSLFYVSMYLYWNGNFLQSRRSDRCYRECVLVIRYKGACPTMTGLTDQMDDTDYINVTVQFCFPNINSSCRKEVRTGAVNTFLFIFLSCVSVCTVFLNLLVIISISHFKQLHTPTNLLLLSLAVADLLVGLVVMPVTVIGFLDSCWYLGKMGCTLYPLISFVSMSASLCSLIFIAVDRYIAISDPLLYSTRVTVCKTSLLIVLGWSLCLFYVMLILYFNDHLLQSQISTRCYGECVIGLKKSWVVIDLVVSFMTPCSVILVLYSVIVSAARRQAKAFRAVVNPASQNPGGRGSGSSETKAAKKLGTVVLVYLACYVPFYICSLSAEAVTSVSVVWIIFGWLQLSNSALNPLLENVLPDHLTVTPTPLPGPPKKAILLAIGQVFSMQPDKVTPPTLTYPRQASPVTNDESVTLGGTSQSYVSGRTCPQV